MLPHALWLLGVVALHPSLDSVGAGASRISIAIVSLLFFIPCLNFSIR